MMLCEVCDCKETCPWYESYNIIKNEVECGLGLDNEVGSALKEVLDKVELKKCESYESRGDYYNEVYGW